jgi:hypothetical protein
LEQTRLAALQAEEVLEELVGAWILHALFALHGMAASERKMKFCRSGIAAA